MSAPEIREGGAALLKPCTLYRRNDTRPVCSHVVHTLIFMGHARRPCRRCQRADAFWLVQSPVEGDAVVCRCLLIPLGDNPDAHQTTDKKETVTC